MRVEGARDRRFMLWRLPRPGLLVCLGPVLIGCVSPVGLPTSFELPAFPVVKQEEPVWCWAACAEMILRFHGDETTQGEVAARISGADDGGTVKVEMASRHEILCALNPDMPRDELEALWRDFEQELLDKDKWLEANWSPKLSVNRPQAFNAVFDKLAPKESPIVEDLLDGHPAVVGLRESKDASDGHAYVLFGARYSQKPKWKFPEMDSEDVADWLDIDMSPDARARLANFQKECKTFGITSPSQFITTSDYEIHEVHLVDPWEGKKVTLSIQEFAPRVDFVITRSYARQILESRQEMVRIKTQ